MSISEIRNCLSLSIIAHVCKNVWKQTYVTYSLIVESHDWQFWMSAYYNLRKGGCGTLQNVIRSTSTLISRVFYKQVQLIIGCTIPFLSLPCYSVLNLCLAQAIKEYGLSMFASLTIWTHLACALTEHLIASAHILVIALFIQCYVIYGSWLDWSFRGV